MKKNIIKLLFVSLFFVAACGSNTKTTTCSFNDDMYVNEYEAKDDEVVAIKQTVAFDLEASGITKKEAKTFAKTSKEGLGKIKGVTPTTKVTDDKMTISIDIDLDEGKLDDLVQEGIISEAIIKEDGDKKYVSLKAAKKNFKEVQGGECK
ncbi:uncharacterized lipoprotein YehR (DUF1307 family) [Breznakia sp. PF5-3]|uniref:DUF1307 domain-containing protein n=1 Tax=unclassified Breznakia TaxID=2623764 RepID=UPI002406F68C|nr:MULTISPECIES: DUF1307 domain-containing protein [unclassified Breznakia]MDF9824468.1 uncharacterized lipoprotein YehR (DUF1307 family) [Breznakia sp. PM6-1]MDF9835249.1 uncharacterized lipoprotein YehR (DUF1307 family) [Breznakia sp. PF5-3]